MCVNGTWNKTSSDSSISTYQQPILTTRSKHIDQIFNPPVLVHFFITNETEFTVFNKGLHMGQNVALFLRTDHPHNLNKTLSMLPEE